MDHDHGPTFAKIRPRLFLPSPPFFAFSHCARQNTTLLLTFNGPNIDRNGGKTTDHAETFNYVRPFSSHATPATLSFHTCLGAASVTAQNMYFPFTLLHHPIAVLPALDNLSLREHDAWRSFLPKCCLLVCVSQFMFNGAVFPFVFFLPPVLPPVIPLNIAPSGNWADPYSTVNPRIIYHC